MKRFLFLIAFVFSLIYVNETNAQNVTGATGLVKWMAGNSGSDVSKKLLWYNTSGALVTKFAGTTGVGALDTVVSQFIPFDADEYKFSFSCGVGDSAYANVGYMLVAGVNPNSLPTEAGFYTRGGIAFVKCDSIISLGLRSPIVGQTAKFGLTSSFIPTGHTSTAGGYQSNRDSTWTNTFGSSAVTLGQLGYIGFRVVMIQYAGATHDVSNTTILNTHTVLQVRRFN